MKTDSLPEKLYYKIGEVAEAAGVEPYVLRYWETEFKEISPIKSRSNQRLYRKKDIETILWIKQLLYQEGFTIDGARRRMREAGRPEFEPKPVEIPAIVFPQDPEFLGQIRKELVEIRSLLK